MSESVWTIMLRNVMEYLARRRFPPEISFDEKDVVSHPFYLRVSSLVVRLQSNLT